MIALVTETLCCMDPSDCAAYGVHLIPLSCALGEETLLDRLLLREESIPDGKGYSIPPSEALYRERFESLLQTHDGVFCITASRKFSESNRHATLAAAAFDGRVVVIDSGTVAGGLFLLVLRARHMITMGYPMSRMKAELESYKNNLRVSFTTQSIQVLENAKRLAYCPRDPADPLPCHPVFRIENGEIGVYELSTGSRRTMEAMLSVFSEPRATAKTAPSRVVVHYANRTASVEYLLERLAQLYPSATLYERPITLSIQLNLGYDIVGVVGD